MNDEKNILETAQALVRQYNLPLKITSIEEGREEVTIFYSGQKRTPLRELAQELELQLQQPVKLERFQKSGTGKIGGVDILGKYPCCAPFLRQCPFAGTYGCGYGLVMEEKKEPSLSPKPSQPPKPTKTSPSSKKPKKKMVRRLVIEK
jgi:hypothetical protein